MNLTNSQRIIKLSINLILNPKYFFSYLKYSIFSNKNSIEHGLPWWSFGAIDEFKKIAKKKIIFEYGTGGSTVLACKIAKQIISVEDNKKWLSIVKSKINRNKKKSKIIYRYFDFKKSKDFEKSSYFKSINQFKWNILIIDGQEGPQFKQRLQIFNYVEKKNLKKKIIIIDDFWRYEELLKKNKAKKIKIFESVGPSRYGVTSTAFFYY